jgi:hypothetical protein
MSEVVIPSPPVGIHEVRLGHRRRLAFPLNRVRADRRIVAFEGVQHVSVGVAAPSGFDLDRVSGGRETDHGERHGECQNRRADDGCNTK